MDKIKVVAGATLALLITCAGCYRNSNQQLNFENEMEQKAVSANLRTADEWVSSPLRNRLTLKLNRNVEEVWALVGDPANMPQYSDGLRKVETEFDEAGNCTAYTCYFKPVDGVNEEIIHHTTIIWHERNTGWASLDPEVNPFGMLQSLSLMTLEADEEQTVFKWQFHFNCENEMMLNFNKDGYKSALDDISQRLIKKFGGTQLENFVEGS
ncbi:MAG: SRPBCC family protein [Imperialibacter sp.]|uniref:SRPBCC family protein n=1 Tax=Imperialibacter sp. TaxID=2038411 RepID=UPI003A8689B0